MKRLLFIPTYNCEKQIVRVLEQLTPELRNHFEEIVIFDNISQDRTVDHAMKFIFENALPIKVIINEQNVNLGGTHKLAFRYAANKNYDSCVILHGDDQADLNDFKFVLEKSYDRETELVLGSRFSLNSKRVNYSPVRTIGNMFFNSLVSLRYLQVVPDFGGSGLNAFQIKFLKQHIFQEMDKYDNDLTFHTFLLMKALSVKAKIHFHPISWREYDQKSNVKLFNQTKKLFKIISRAKI